MKNIKILLFLAFLISACEEPVKKNKYTNPIQIKNFELLKNPIILNEDEFLMLRKKIIYLNNIKRIKENEILFEFDINKIPEYIDCGFMNNEVYVNYIERIFGSSLSANLKFEKSKKNKEFIFKNIIVLYTFRSSETGTRWRFQTNKPKELLVGNPVYDDNPYRTCASKNKLEKKIFDILYEIKN